MTQMKHKIKPFEEFKNKVNEEFYNPFEKDNPVDVKPSHIADKGGFLKARKEVFNINRVEYSKKKNGSYCVLAKTQFAKGEIVEIAPVIFVGFETKAVPRLKDYIFEIDKTKGQYGVVLGYGSLYGHSPTPNITFAYNKENRQMYFIAAKTVNAGAELTIDYGKDYWAERSGFGAMAPAEQPVKAGEAIAKGESDKNESMVQPNSEDLTNASAAKQFGQPNSNANPAISGIAIKGIGQQ
jgi:uncharacterized protein